MNAILKILPLILICWTISSCKTKSLPQTESSEQSIRTLLFYGEYSGAEAEWGIIGAKSNPFHLSDPQVMQVQEELAALHMWNQIPDGRPSAELQKAIMYYRLVYGMTVECVLYPHNLMLKSTYCSLFYKDVRCQQGYEF